MQLIFVENVNDVPHEVDDYLATDALMNNICLGILKSCRQNPAAFPISRFFWLEDEGQILAYAHHFPPYPLCLSVSAAPETAQLAASLAPLNLDFDAVHGSSKVSEKFFSAWPALASRKKLVERQGLYRLDKVIFPNFRPGVYGLAEERDCPLLVVWHRAFCLETGSPVPAEEELMKVYRERLASRSVFVLRDGPEAVAMAAATRDLGKGRVISYVYTPPERRQRGYASYLVATLSDELLRQGYEFCCLFSQLENATSNKIYQSIGYRLISEFSLSKLANV